MKGFVALTIFLPAFFCSPKAATQDSTSRFSMLLSPALFIPVSVAVQGGMQYKAGKKWSVVIEAAFPTFYPKNTPYEKITYWRTGAEIRHWFGRKMRSSKKYLSLQTHYLYRKLADREQAFYYTKTQTFSYQNAVISTPVLSAALKLGAEVPAGKRTFVDAFIGLGPRFVFTRYNAQKSSLTSLEPVRQQFFKFDDAWLFNYTLTRIHFAAGLRFGIRL